MCRITGQCFICACRIEKYDSPLTPESPWHCASVERPFSFETQERRSKYATPTCRLQRCDIQERKLSLVLSFARQSF
jgi:hypothetical protein